MVPTLHRSALALYLWNCKISGAMYRGDPHKVSARPCGCRLRAKPKSAIFSSAPDFVVDSRRFCGLRSRYAPAEHTLHTKHMKLEARKLTGSVL